MSLSQTCGEVQLPWCLDFIPGNFPNVRFVSLIFPLSSQRVSDLILVDFLEFETRSWRILHDKVFCLVFFFSNNFRMFYF